MTPLEFDHLYFEYAQALGAATGPGLLRDRLILLLLQHVDVATGLDAIRAAAAMPTITELKQANSDIEPLVTAHH